MMNPSLHSGQRPNKRIAFSSRFNHMHHHETTATAQELWPLSIDGPVKIDYLPVSQPSYAAEFPSKVDQGESKQVLSSDASSGPSTALYSSTPQHANQASQAHLHADLSQLPGSKSSIAIQPRADTALHQSLSHSSPSLHSRTGVRMKPCRGSKSAEQKLEPTWKGFIGSTYEALQLLEGCLSGNLRHMPRRAYDREREEVIRSGHVFVFEENTSGIKRWTDGIAWSPSRLLPNFLIYREVEAKDHQPGEKKRAIKKRKRSDDETQSDLDDGYADPIAPILNPNDLALSIPEPERRRLCGSLTDSYNFKSDGLVKKTISVEYRGNVHHIIAYYNLEDVIYGRLPRMQDDAKLRELTPRFELLNFHKFQGNPDNPLDDPIRYCNQMRQSDVQPQWLQYPNGLLQHNQILETSSQPQSSPAYYSPMSQQTHQSGGYWPPPAATQWTQQSPMIEAFTPLSTGPQYCTQRSDSESHNASPITPMSYTSTYINHYPPAFNDVYSEPYIPS